MTEAGFFYTPSDFQLLPSIAIRATDYCEDCGKVHGLQLAFQLFWYGIMVNHLRD